ncbi:hypothetical protein Pcinc_032362 [Petrolisthes cinctipes]|uniref:DNA cross-link repair 1A protein n=1 Tax=Petrolisthes cinctipes TaxID=88211 RepID=A0AAE1EUH5_PETCI|nr:hypothetical protein Pcinc_032362 [Petrolisthes cinctipes]
MSTDSEEDDSMICTPLQRSRSQISSIQSEKKKPLQFYSQCDQKKVTNDTKFKAPLGSQKKSVGCARSKLSRSVSRSSSSLGGKVKKEHVFDINKRNFFYTSNDIQANSSQKRKSPNTSQNGNLKRERMDEFKQKESIKQKWDVKQEETSCSQDELSVSRSSSSLGGKVKKEHVFDINKRNFFYTSNDSQANSSQKRKSPNTSQNGNLKRERMDEFKQEESIKQEWDVKQEETSCSQDELSVCPNCMMPWNIYMRFGKTKQFHVDECLNRNLSNKPECSKGLECKQVLENHFWNYRHTIQAHLISSRTPPSGYMGVRPGSSKGDSQIVNSTNLQEQNNVNRSPSDDSGYGDHNVVPGPSGLQRNNNSLYPSKRFQGNNNHSLDSEEDEESDTASLPLFENSEEFCNQNANRQGQEYQTNIGNRGNIIGNYSVDNGAKCGSMNKNGYKGAKCSFTDNHSTKVNSIAAKNTRVNTTENTPVNSKRSISEIPSKQENELVLKKTGAKDITKDYNKFLDSPEVPDLDMRPDSVSPSTTISDSHSDSRTILFTGSPCIQRVESMGCGDVHENSIDNENFSSDHNGDCTQNFEDHMEEDGKVKNNRTANIDNVDTNSTSSSLTESYSSQSLLKNVSRNLFRENGSTTNKCSVFTGAAQERDNGSAKAKSLIIPRERLPNACLSSCIGGAQENGPESTESLKLTLQRESLADTSSTGTISSCSNTHIQTVKEGMPKHAETSHDMPHEGTEGICGAGPLINSKELPQGMENETVLSQEREGGRADSISDTDVENIEVCETNKASVMDVENLSSGEMDRQSETDAGNLDDSDEDNLLVNMVEAAVEKYLGDIVDRVRERRRSGESGSLPSQHTANNKPVEKRGSCTTTDNKHISGGGGEQCECKCSSHSQSGVHFHLHMDSPSGKKGGQTSILNFFSSSSGKDRASEKQRSKNNHCDRWNGSSGSSKMSSRESNKRQGVKEWQELLSKMKERLKTPSVFSSVEEKESGSERGGGRGGAGGAVRQKFEQTGQRKCPFYKYILDTDMVVDAFSYGVLPRVTAYFLSHFHYDHYRGLNKRFSQPIYCSHITAQLVQERLGVSKQYLCPLPLDQPQQVCGAEVTLLDANHCPGAVLFLFKLSNGLTVLHTGDFRAHPRMESYPALWNCNNIDTLYLDTTYCNPVYDFPSQEEVVEACVSVAQNHVADNPKTLIVVGSYTIGKERVFKAIAAALDCLVWVSGDKRRILNCLNDAEIKERITCDKKKARVHVLPMAHLTPKKLMTYTSDLQPLYSVVVAIKPTGWEHSSDTPTALDATIPKQFGNVYIYGMPYSEHSSFTELRRFVQFTRPKRIIPTVNVGNPNTRRNMETLLTS